MQYPGARIMPRAVTLALTVVLAGCSSVLDFDELVLHAGADAGGIGEDVGVACGPTGCWGALRGHF